VRKFWCWLLLENVKIIHIKKRKRKKKNSSIHYCVPSLALPNKPKSQFDQNLIVIHLKCNGDFKSHIRKYESERLWVCVVLFLIKYVVLRFIYIVWYLCLHTIWTRHTNTNYHPLWVGNFVSSSYYWTTPWIRMRLSYLSKILCNAL